MSVSKKNDSRSANTSKSSPRSRAARRRRNRPPVSTPAPAVAIAARLANVVPGDRDRVHRSSRPAQNSIMSQRPGASPAQRKHRVLAGEELLQDVDLERAREAVRRHPDAAPRPGRSSDDGAGAMIVIEMDTWSSGDPVERFHVVERCRSRRPPGRPGRCRGRVGVMSGLHQQVEGGPKGRSDRGRAGSGSARSSPRATRSRRTAASSIAARGTSTDTPRA